MGVIASARAWRHRSRLLERSRAALLHPSALQARDDRVSHADARNRVYASRGPLTADAELWALPHQQRSLIGMRVSPDRRTTTGDQRLPSAAEAMVTESGSPQDDGVKGPASY